MSLNCVGEEMEGRGNTTENILNLIRVCIIAQRHTHLFLFLLFFFPLILCSKMFNNFISGKKEKKKNFNTADLAAYREFGI